MIGNELRQRHETSEYGWNIKIKSIKFKISRDEFINDIDISAINSETKNEILKGFDYLNNGVKFENFPLEVKKYFSNPDESPP